MIIITKSTLESVRQIIRQIPAEASVIVSTVIV
jgi:hypothetical protein